MKQFAVRISAALGCATFALAAGHLAVNAQEAEEAEPDVGALEPVGVMTAYEVMSEFVDPHFIELQEGLAAEPDRRAWRTIRQAALATSETANLLFLYVPEEGADEWKQMTVDFRVKSYDLMNSAKENDYEASKTKYLALVESCNKCHERFEPEIAPKIEP